MSTISYDKEERVEKRLRVSFKFSDNMQMSIVGDTIDELITGLEGLNNVVLINEFVSRFDLTEEQFGRLDNMILETNNPREIDRYLSNRGYKVNNVDRFEKALLEIGDVYIMTRFSHHNQGKYFNQIEDAVIASDDSRVIISFSRIKGADLRKIKHALWNSRNLGFCREFCIHHRDVPGLITTDDIKLLEEWVIQSEDASIIYNVIRTLIDGIDNDRLIDALIRTKNAYYITDLADKQDGVNIEKLQEAIINNGSADDIFKFARDVKGADIRALFKAIKRTGDKQYIRRFRKNIKCDFFLF